MKLIFILVIVVMFLFRTWVKYLNLGYTKKPLPDNVKDIYDEKAYKKWLDYHRANLVFGLISSIVFMVLTLGLLIFDVFQVFESWASDISDAWYLQTFIFIAIFMTIEHILSLPFDYYHTFKIEEVYGFNRSTKKTFILDQIKGFVLSIVLTGGLIVLVESIFRNFDEAWLFVLIVWGSLVVIVLVFNLLYIKVFIKIFNKLTPLEDGALKDKIHALAKSIGYEVDKISVMDASKRSSKLNAFFSGFGKSKDVVLYDTLIEKMSEEEIVAVLAHELGHATYKDTTKMFLANILNFGIIALVIAVLLENSAFYTDFGFDGVFVGFTYVLLTIIMGPLMLVINVVINWWMRKIEYRADHFAKIHTHKDHMIKALEVIAKENFANLNPHPLQIILQYNHPTISQRIEALNQEG